MARFSELMRQLGQVVDLPFDGIGSPAEFTLDGVPVTVSSEVRGAAEDVVLHARLGAVPQARELEVYRILLEANVLWSGTGDATLGVNSATREAVLCFRNPADRLSGDSFAALLDAFIEVAANWRNLLEAANEAAETGGEPAAPIDQTTMIRG